MLFRMGPHPPGDCWARFFEAVIRLQLGVGRLSLGSWPVLRSLRPCARAGA